MKKVVVAMIAGLTLMAGASAFAKGGGGDGGSRTFELSMAHRDAVMAKYKAEHAQTTETSVAKK
jgi:hypothetical protein